MQNKRESNVPWLPFWRLFLVGVITGWSMLKLTLCSWFGLRTPEATAALTKQWGQRMLKWMNCKIQVKGHEPPRGCLLMANHRTYMDIPVILNTTHATFLAKEEVKGWPLLGGGAKLIDTVFVKRENKGSRKEARRVLKEKLLGGTSIIMFPEGTTTGQSVLGELHPGMFVTAAEQHLPIVPIAIEYAHEDDPWVHDEGFLTHFLRCFRRQTMVVAMTVGPVMHGTDPAQLQAEYEAWIKQELKALGGQVKQASFTALPEKSCDRVSL